MTQTLLSPFRLHLVLRNRVLMTPMTRECALDEVTTEEMAPAAARHARMSRPRWPTDAWILSDSASCMTGEAVVVDGGSTIR